MKAIRVGEHDRWRSPQQLIEQHDGDAQMQAAHRVDRAKHQGDAEAKRFGWLQMTPDAGPLN
jgi:hypothetical protein